MSKPNLGEDFIKFMEITTKALERLDNNDNILEKRMKLLEEASKLKLKMLNELNNKINILDEALQRVAKSNKVDYKED